MKGKLKNYLYKIKINKECKKKILSYKKYIQAIKSINGELNLNIYTRYWEDKTFLDSLIVDGKIYLNEETIKQIIEFLKELETTTLIIFDGLNTIEDKEI